MYEPVYDEGDWSMEDFGEGMEEEKPFPWAPVIGGGIGGLVLLIIIICVAVSSAKKKKARQRELEDLDD